ncbi:hypothetical protein QH494_05785 [Sphingomonas sp. AR_OL41]|uniref:hypothetical protein n=1 Tax=Sphingomonas sp. AR_OL41 TaxID=3042729 RepID=UPI00248165EA|nr:hypothetical protein [Sphingomonas sp. AR_OL41]MDH7971687.1 hypothetical protein [Sphingomonas sp. AR_OL41]
MRVALGITVSVLCLASPPVMAGTGAAPRGSAPLQDLRTGTATAHRDAPSSATLRIYRDATMVQPSLGEQIDAAGRVRQRLRSSMMEFYPSGDGFHVAAGVRMFERQNFFNDAQRVTHGLLYNPRGTNAESIRAGFRSYTPAMTMGYTRTVSEGLTLGLEGGALLGRAASAMPRSFRLAATGSNGGDHGGINPVANMVVGFHF